MKQLIKSYLSFTRSERIGLLGLCILLVIFIIARATMSWWVQPSSDLEKEKELTLAWEKFKRNLPETPTDDETNEAKNDYQDVFDENKSPLPYKTDLNKADSATLVRFKGIGPATAKRIITWRNENGPFTNIEQLQEIRHFPDSFFNILRQHLVVANADSTEEK